MKTYCRYSGCPFKDCELHLQNAKKLKGKVKWVRLVDYAGVCERYLRLALKEVMKEEAK